MTSQPEPTLPFHSRRTADPAAPTPSASRVLTALGLIALLWALAGPATAATSVQEQASAAKAEVGRATDVRPAPAKAEEPQQMEAETSDAAASAGSTEPAEPPAVDTAAGIVAADRALAEAVADGNADAFRDLLADDAVFLSAQGTLQGRDAIVTGWGSLMAKDRAATLTWDPKGARVAGSRELGYSVGTYTLTVKRSAGDPLQSQGQYITVWTRDAAAGGPWKVLFDGPLRRGLAAYLERALGEQGRIGPKTGSAFSFVPERLVTAKSDDLSVTFGTYQAQRIDMDGSYHAAADGTWFSVWATNPKATPDEATRLLPAGDSITAPQAVAVEQDGKSETGKVDETGPGEG